VLALAAAVAAGLVLAASASAADTAPWKAAAQVRQALSDAQAALVLGDGAGARSRVAAAEDGVERLLGKDRAAMAAFATAERAAADGDEAALAAARSILWTATLALAFREASAAASGGDVARARSWLLVREFRPPTRFSRASDDATVALDRLEAGAISPRGAAAAVRHDLLDTYDYRLRTALADLREAHALRYRASAAELGALARGYWSIVEPVYRAQHGRARASALSGVLDEVAAASLGGRLTLSQGRAERGLEGFRAAPLTEEELVRRAGQLDRFLQLVPIEYGRGVSDGHVTLDFEIQEAVTFRDGAETAYEDLLPALIAIDAAAARRLGAHLDALETALEDAARGDAVAPPDEVEATTGEALALVAGLYPDRWREAAKTADFDVIAATLDRLQGATAAGDWKGAESARLEAYGIFELGPEQRLRGLAPALFQEVEGYFWYGQDGLDGLVQLIARKATDAELAETRAALDDALARSEQQIGDGPQSSVSVVTNAAIIVFREGLEAVLILAALMASLVGSQRHLRRPMLAGVGLALVASACTWVVAQTVLMSFAGYGEKLEAIVSLVAIGVLLLILNWFYHRVYWQENLQTLHQRKRRILSGTGMSIVTAQVAGLVLLGFTSVYREGFETVLFLQAMTLEAGALTVLQGVALGFAGVVAVYVLVVALERRLPHKKMLVATGLLITWVLVVMVGTTVQTMQKVGWVGVTPIEGLELPYWAGLWLGLYPTRQGIGAQLAAALLVIGSYVAAEVVRKRRRTRMIASLATPVSTSVSAEPGGIRPSAVDHAAEPVATR
jgi:high-affinity iron transporter